MALDKTMKEFFGQGGKPYVGITLPGTIATAAIKYLPPFTSSSVVLDNGCGPATATGKLIAKCVADGQQPPKIYATDNSEGMIQSVRDLIAKEKWDTVTTELMDGKDLSGFEDDYFTHSITGLAVNIFGAKGIYRTLQKGGTAVMTLWKYQPLVELANQVRERLHPGLPTFPPGFPVEWWEESFFIRTVDEGGFKDYKMDLIEFSETYESVEKLKEDFRTPFYAMARNGLSDEETERFEAVLDEIMKERSPTFHFEVRCITATK